MQALIKQELQPQGLSALKTSDESKFAAAIREIKIKDMSYEEVKKPLKYAMLVVGLREINFPVELEFRIIIEHLKNHYGNHTASEIRLAFDLAVAGKLELKEVSCFENFSCLYISSVLNAYRAWAKETYKVVKPEPIMIEKEFHSLSDDEFIESNRKKYTESKNYLLITVLCYEMLVRSGKINLTNDEKLEIKKKVTANYFSLENKAEIQNKSQGEKDIEIKQNCKRWATANYFNSL